MYLYINMWSVSFYLHSFISWDLNQSFKFVTKTWPNPPVFESFESEWKAVPSQNSPNKKIFTDKHFGKLVSEPLGCLLWFSMGHNSFGLFSLHVSREADGFLPGFVFAKVNVPLFHLWIYKACQRHCQTGGQYERMKNICYICFFFLSSILGVCSSLKSADYLADNIITTSSTKDTDVKASRFVSLSVRASKWIFSTSFNSRLQKSLRHTHTHT